MLVVGEAGMGKSRRLHEFETWLELRPESVYYFKGRAVPALQSVPYGILRDLFACRFEILESDTTTAALTRFRAGMQGVLPPERADLVGHLVGFDFSDSPAEAVPRARLLLVCLARSALLEAGMERGGTMDLDAAVAEQLQDG